MEHSVSQDKWRTREGVCRETDFEPKKKPFPTMRADQYLIGYDLRCELPLTGSPRAEADDHKSGLLQRGFCIR